MNVFKFEGGLAVSIPDEIAKSIGLNEGNEVTISKIDGKSFKIERKPTRQELIEGLRKYRGMMPADFKFDRDEANER
jgi:antitoxin MazE